MEHHSVVDENEIHYDGKQDEYVKEHTDDDKEEVGDDGGT